MVMEVLTPLVVLLKGVLRNGRGRINGKFKLDTKKAHGGLGVFESE